MTDIPNRVSKQQLHFMALIIVITLKFHTTNILDCYLPQYSHVCLLRVSASFLENKLNKEGIV